MRLPVLADAHRHARSPRRSAVRACHRAPILVTDDNRDAANSLAMLLKLVVTKWKPHTTA